MLLTMKSRRAIPIAACVVLLLGCGDTAPPDAAPPSGAGISTPALTAAYVGAARCADCHAAEHAAWRNSHHDLALQVATEQTVLGRFEGTHGPSRFEQADGEFRIVAAPGDTVLPVRYTFGVAPLQQYVVDAGNGRLQVYPVPWDTRPAAAGGQRWYDLHPGDPPPGDPMHWSGRANRWNSQCADCHSTDVRKRFDPATAGYTTTFAEEDVACEVCHGPGSLHAADPADRPLRDLGVRDAAIDVCARCHSRRSQIAEGFEPAARYLDHYAPALIEDGLYHLDGQILDEVFEYGSFLQSRMHRAGVGCGDCHDPHSATLKRPGNTLCTHCHQPQKREEFPTLNAKIYDDPSHTLHAQASPGAACVACHMPTGTYMGVDARRDHGMLSPRPDLAVSLGVPEPCTGCHAERTAEWAADVIRDHFGPERPAHFATAFAAGARGEAAAEPALAALARDLAEPIMVRASALARLSGYSRGYTLEAVSAARNDEALLRYAAPRAAAGLTAANRFRLIAPLLDDPLRAVRNEAFLALLPLAADDLAYRARLAAYLPTYREELAWNRDFPETLTNIAAAYAALGDPGAAERELDAAIALEPSWVPARLNLADVYRATGRDEAAGSIYRQAIAIAPEAAEPQYGYGLWLSRQGDPAGAVGALARAAVLAPEVPAYAYALALAQNGIGDGRAAVETLGRLVAAFPEHTQALYALATILRDQARFTEALDAAERLVALHPDDPALTELVRSLAASARQPATAPAARSAPISDSP